MRRTSIFTAAVVAAFVGTSVQAATIYATGIVFDRNGAVVGNADNRNTPGNALGEPDQKFFSLGLGGQADFTFGQLFTGPGESYEITFGNRTGYTETADVFVGLGGDFTFVTAINNASPSAFVFNFPGVFDTLRLVDTSPFVSGRDGYDVDAVGVTAFNGPVPGPQPIPLPASVLLLGAGLAGLGALRRKS